MRLAAAALHEARGQAILIIHIDLHIGYNADHRDRCVAFKHLDTGVQDLLVSPELVDDQAFDHLLLFRFQQQHGACQLGKYAAPVDISCKQDRSPDHPGKSHIDDVLGFQVDLGR